VAPVTLADIPYPKISNWTFFQLSVS